MRVHLCVFSVASFANDPMWGEAERLAAGGLRRSSVNVRTTAAWRHSVDRCCRGSQRCSEFCRLPSISSEGLWNLLHYVSYQPGLVLLVITR